MCTVYFIIPEYLLVPQGCLRKGTGIPALPFPDVEGRGIGMPEVIHITGVKKSENTGGKNNEQHAVNKTTGNKETGVRRVAFLLQAGILSTAYFTG